MTGSTKGAAEGADEGATVSRLCEGTEGKVCKEYMLIMEKDASWDKWKPDENEECRKEIKERITKLA